MPLVSGWLDDCWPVVVGRGRRADDSRLFPDASAARATPSPIRQFPSHASNPTGDDERKRAGRGRETPWSGAAAGGAAEQSRAEQAARHAALAWMEPEPDASIEYDRVASIHASASALGGPRTPAHPRRAAWASITGEAVTDLSTVCPPAQIKLHACVRCMIQLS